MFGFYLFIKVKSVTPTIFSDFDKMLFYPARQYFTFDETLSLAGL